MLDTKNLSFYLQATKSKSPLELMKNQPLPNDKSCVGSQISVSCYNVLDRIFPNVNASSASEHTSLQNRLMIEDVFHCQVCNSSTWPRCLRQTALERVRLKEFCLVENSKIEYFSGSPNPRHPLLSFSPCDARSPQSDCVLQHSLRW